MSEQGLIVFRVDGGARLYRAGQVAPRSGQIGQLAHIIATAYSAALPPLAAGATSGERAAATLIMLSRVTR